MIFGEKWKTTLVKKITVGEDLIQAFEDRFKEFPKVSDNTKARLAGNLIFRFTRIGIFAILFTSIPIILLYQQNMKIDNQNDLITKQNERLDQQTYLLEADRRGALVHLFSNVLDAMDTELKNNLKRSLSPQLIGSIISLSRALKPYYFLDNDKLISKPLSPERGQLLALLVSSEISDESLKKIFKGGKFDYSDLVSIDFSEKLIVG